MECGCCHSPAVCAEYPALGVDRDIRHKTKSVRTTNFDLAHDLGRDPLVALCFALSAAAGVEAGRVQAALGCCHRTQLVRGRAALAYHRLDQGYNIYCCEEGPGRRRLLPVARTRAPPPPCPPPPCPRPCDTEGKTQSPEVSESPVRPPRAPIHRKLAVGNRSDSGYSDPHWVRVCSSRTPMMPLCPVVTLDAAQLTHVGLLRARVRA